MICFKDMTFCSWPCANMDCPRQFTEADNQAAIKWWGSDEAPVAFADFHETCPDYIQETK